jgi:hypothetical protein
MATIRGRILYGHLLYEEDFPAGVDFEDSRSGDTQPDFVIHNITSPTQAASDQHETSDSKAQSNMPQQLNLTETLTMLDKIEVLQKKGKPKKVD